MNGCVYRTADSVCKFWSDNGKGVVSYCDFDDCVDKHPSNADRIRAMTDEELAELLSKVALEGMNGGVTSKGVWTKAEIAGGVIVPWLEWLKQEAES